MRRTCAVLFLVAVVQAIVVAIADPRFRYAALVSAGEVPRVGTGLHRWFRVGIGHAHVTVVLEFFAVGTRTLGVQLLGLVIGHGKTHLLAATAVVRAGMQTSDALSLSTVHLDTIKPVRLRFPHHDLFLFSGELVETHDCIESPVGDVHPVIVNDDRERMPDQP